MKSETTILKYKLSLQDGHTIRIPSPQRFLSVQYQYDDLCVWYEANAKPSEEDFDDIFFMVVGTGYPVPEKSQYLGTVQHGSFVWHIYAKCDHGK